LVEREGKRKRNCSPTTDCEKGGKGEGVTTSLSFFSTVPGEVGRGRKEGRMVL